MAEVLIKLKFLEPNYLQMSETIKHKEKADKAHSNTTKKFVIVEHEKIAIEI